MNIVEFWKQKVHNCTNNNLYNKEDFIQSLNINVPDWEEQIKDKYIWRELHTQGNNVNEVIYTKVFIEKLGVEYACYLIENQWGKRHFDASCALDYCAEIIETNWNNFTENTKEKLLSFKLKDFLNVCDRNINLWTSLTDTLKNHLLDNAQKEEKEYFFDLIIYNIWKNELSYSESSNVIFFTDDFRKLAEEIKRDKERGKKEEHFLQEWKMPRLDVGQRLEYIPSIKISTLNKIAETANDNESVSTINKLINTLKNLCR